MDFLTGNQFGLVAILILFGAFQGYFLAAVFIFANRGRRSANWTFAALLLVMSLHLTELALYIYGQLWRFPQLDATTFPLLFLIGPLYLLYTRLIVQRDIKFRWHYLLHLAPAIACFLYLLPHYLADAELKAAYLKEFPPWKTPIIPLGVYILLATQQIQTICYLLFSLRDLRIVGRQVRNYVSDHLTIAHFDRLQFLTFGFIVYTMSYLIVFLLLVFFGSYGVLIDRIWLLLLAAFIQAISYVALQKPEFFSVIDANLGQETNIHPETVKNGTAPKYRKSALSSEQAHRYLEQLSTFMTEKKPYLEPDLKLADLAAEIDIPANHLSQVINQECGQKFFDFVNAYRVELAQSLLKDPAYEHYTILAIAFEAGFNNKASFNRSFKKITGMTPSAFRAREHADS